MQTSIVQFGNVIFDQQQARLRIEGESIQLEHQQARLLNFLIEQRETIVSRQQIADEIWQDVIVEDNTINKAITRLRKVLNDSAKSPQFIKTVPKKGYQFIASVKDYVEPKAIEQTQDPAQPNEHTQPTISDSESKSQSQSPKVVKGKANGVLPIIFLVIMALGLYSHWQNVKSKSTNSNVQETLPKPISYREGIELNGHLHADRNSLLFVGDRQGEQNGDKTEGYGIYLQLLGQSQAKLITPINSRYVYPKWLNDERRSFVYSDLDDQRQCQIYKVNVATQVEQQADQQADRRKLQQSNIEAITTCSKATPAEVFVVQGTGSGASTGKDSGVGDSIFWSDDAGSWRQDLSSGARREIAFGSKTAKFQMPSPNGQLWASLSDAVSGSLLTIVDAETQRTVMEHQLPYLISHFKWSAASDAVFHLGEHPSNQLYRLSLSGDQTLLASTSLGFMTRISDVQSDDSIEFIISMVDLDIHQHHQGRETILANSPFADYNPALSAKSQHLAFASKRTGAAQIWLKPNNGSPRQLSQFARAGYIYEIVWSPDEKSLLVKRNESIHIFDLETQNSTELPMPAHDKVAWQWLSNTRLAYVDKASNSLFSYDLATKATLLMRANVGWAQYQQGEWFISDPQGLAVTQFTRDFTNATVLTNRLNRRTWLFIDQQLYLVNRNNDRRATVVTLDENGVEREVFSGRFSPISVRSTPQGHFVYQVLSSNEANVYQLKLK